MQTEINKPEVFVNKVEESGIVSIDLENFYPSDEIVMFDIKGFLFMELILKEKDFREALKKLDWSVYRSKTVGIICSADAVIPMWAYMLLSSYLQPVAKDVYFGNQDFIFRTLFIKNINAIDLQEFADKRVVIKGCGDKAISETAFVEITKLLRPTAKSIMYGEPCSTVPIFKKKAI